MYLKLASALQLVVDMEEDEKLVTFEKLVHILRRRFWWMAIPVLLGPLLAISAAYLVTPVYTSQAFVLVERPKVSDKYVTSMITDELDARLMTMKEQILSRSRLEPIVVQLGLYKQDHKASMEDKVERLRRSVDVKTIRGDLGRAPSGFYITAETNNARTAQQVCSEILSMFLSENLKVRQQHAAGTTQFLADQLAESKRNLDAQEGKLAEFKRKYFGQLPSDEQRNLELLNSTRARLETANQELSQAQQQKVVLESTLSQQLASKRSSPSGSTRSDMQTQIASQQALLSSLQARYTDQHPDVIKAKSQLAAMQAQMRAESAENNEPKEDPALSSPEIRQARTSLRLTEEMIRGKRAEQARLEGEVRNLQGRLQLTPGVEEQFKSLTRDHDTAQLFYNDLLTKKTQSEMATDLERRQEGEQFGVMDAPDLPSKPTFPSRFKFAMAGLVGGLALGSALTYAMERRENFIRTEEDVVKVLGLAVLVGIPEVEPADHEKTSSIPFVSSSKRSVELSERRKAGV